MLVNEVIPTLANRNILLAVPAQEGVGRRDRSGRECGDRSGEGVTSDAPPREPKPCRFTLADLAECSP